MLGLLAAAVPVGTLVGTAVIAAGAVTTTGCCATPRWCGAGHRRLPPRRLFWFEVGGAGAFVAFVDRRRHVRGVDPHQHRHRHSPQPRHPGLGDGHRGRRAHGQPGARRRRSVALVASVVGPAARDRGRARARRGVLASGRRDHAPRGQAPARRGWRHRDRRHPPTMAALDDGRRPRARRGALPRPSVSGEPSAPGGSVSPA